ncbi:hypothetical protein EV176_001832, partial [Coemansia sp. RSA 451]
TAAAATAAVPKRAAAERAPWLDDVLRPRVVRAAHWRRVTWRRVEVAVRANIVKTENVMRISGRMQKAQDKTEATQMSVEPTAAKPTVAALEEDDEFEEFETEDWGEMDEDKEDANLWDDNWDDDNLEDDFSKQLRAELGKVSQSQPMVVSK